MYKKIGLFKDLDDKFEIEGAEEMMKAKEEGGAEGGDDMGGGDLGGLGGMDMGGADELDMGGGEEGGAEGGEELAENKFRKAQNLSDKYVGNMLNELLGPDESNKKSSPSEDNALIRKSKSMNLESQRLIDSMSGNLRSKRKTVIQEIKESPLVGDSEKLGDDSDVIMNDIEKFLRNRKNNNDAQ